MTKSNKAATLTCNICDFKGTNAYIFKRHMHRCLTLHGIASKRSSPRNPIRLKGTEDLFTSKDGQSSKEIPSAEEEGGSNLGLGDIEMNESASESLETSLKADKMDKGKAWKVADSMYNDDTEADDSKGFEGKDDDCDSNSLILPQSEGTPTFIPGARYTRTYNCIHCSFQCKSARENLYHLRDVHGSKKPIYECKLCDYASQYNNKVERHMSVHKKGDFTFHLVKPDPSPVKAVRRGERERKSVLENKNFDDDDDGEEEEEEEEENEVEGNDADGGGIMKVKPLKLRRLHIKTPSLFKVSGPSKGKPSPSVSPSSSFSPDSSSSKKGKGGVVKMVLLEDGNHHYQCRDCMYFSNYSHNVKKHHTLCHNKLLVCPHCKEFKSASQASYYEHLLTHSGYGYMKCSDCSYVTGAKANFDKHRTFHEHEFPIKCPLCNFGSDSESKIKRHVATQHRNSSEEGEEDLESSVGMDSEGMPEDSVSGVGDEYGTVPEEGVDLDDSAGWVDDTDDFQKPQMPKTASKATKDGDAWKTEYKCPKCPTVCYRRGNFTRHLITKHKMSQPSATLMSKSMDKPLFGKRGVKRRQPQSQKIVSKKRLYMQFMGEETLKCSHCSYSAKWPSDLRRHMLVHTIVRRFQCTLCPNKYKYFGDLNVHMRRDHNQEPPECAMTIQDTHIGTVIKKASPAAFRCPVCPYTTGSKADLEQHSKTHGTIDKTYQCRRCDYQTYWRGDVGRHLYRHHAIVLSKDAVDVSEHFIHRPEIRPITKQPTYTPSSSSSHPPKSPASDVQPVTPEKSNGVRTSTPSPSSVPKEGSFVCEYPDCEFKTTTAERMENHLGIHLNLKQFMCPVCGKRTNWKWDIVKHMNRVHNNPNAAVEDVVTLSIEEAKSTIDDYLEIFEKRIKEMAVNFCSLCGFRSHEKNRVVRHMGAHHKNESGKVITHIISDMEEYEASKNAERDASLVSSDQSQPPVLEPAEPVFPTFEEPTVEEMAGWDKPYACAICRKPGVNKGDIKKHYNYTHPYKDVRVICLPNGVEFNYYTSEIYQKASDEINENVKLESTQPGSSPMKFSDSKYSNPKMHGYVKPFKCSVCGLRSNWKWDLKKHLRAKHPSEGGFVIMLSIEEASQTYASECSPSQPKDGNFTKASPRPSQSTPSPTQFAGKADQLFKRPSSVRSESADSESGSPEDKSFQEEKRILGRVDTSKRQWRCSGCNYVSSWRRNMARHVNRRHPGQKNVISIIPLFSKSKPHSKKSQQSLMDKYLKNGMPTMVSLPSKESSVSTLSFPTMGNTSKDILPRKSSVVADVRVWNCPKCTFTSQLRTHIIIHMQRHQMEPFRCGVCQSPFMNRGPLHRHIQNIHQRPDYIKLTKLNIRYEDSLEAEQTDQGTLVNSYVCKICSEEFRTKAVAEKHLLEVHESSDPESIVKEQRELTITPKPTLDFESVPVLDPLDKAGGRKFHFCPQCPFRSQKKSMLAFHMTYHKPSAGNKLKCKYCNYYVSTTRLLHQHQKKWHTSKGGKTVWTPKSDWDDSPPLLSTPPSSPSHESPSTPGSGGGSRRHVCEKCPYTTNSKNDFIYHKQFHRPKRTAEFKCEYCDYWVVHKRLLKQHMRLHTEVGSAHGSADTSPVKSVYSDPGLVYDANELSELAAAKQRLISSKITACLSKSPTVSPMKLASQCAVDDKPGFVIKNGLYRKLHRCRHCPYTNVRSRNMQLHELMHGPRKAPHPLMKCRYCDYYVGSKGLLSHHMKVHDKSYGESPETDAELAEIADGMEDAEDVAREIQPQQKVDTLLQISRFKRYGCERCPYASAKRAHFQRHLELHGSRQRYTCQYCDYSVPSNNLLLQHTKLHLLPNQNLLASQSLNNLHHLSEVPADVALASALPPADADTPVTISVVHDHLGLYENNIYDSEPKKLYRCDRCPYANVRRDYLLAHLKFHMVSSSMICPYCDYSAPKQALLTQHIRVHFCPLPELSDWLLENGQTDRCSSQQQNQDLVEALKIAHVYQNQSKKKEKGKPTLGGDTNVAEKVPNNKEEKPLGKENKDKKDTPLTYICQYCDRDFPTSEKLVKHELQHLIGNHFEASMKALALEAEEKKKSQLLKQQQRQQPTQSGDKVDTSKTSNEEPVEVTVQKNINEEDGEVMIVEEPVEDKVKNKTEESVTIIDDNDSKDVEGSQKSNNMNDEEEANVETEAGTSGKEVVAEEIADKVTHLEKSSDEAKKLETSDGATKDEDVELINAESVEKDVEMTEEKELGDKSENEKQNAAEMNDEVKPGTEKVIEKEVKIDQETKADSSEITGKELKLNEELKADGTDVAIKEEKMEIEEKEEMKEGTSEEKAVGLGEKVENSDSTYNTERKEEDSVVKEKEIGKEKEGEEMKEEEINTEIKKEEEKEVEQEAEKKKEEKKADEKNDEKVHKEKEENSGEKQQEEGENMKKNDESSIDDDKEECENIKDNCEEKKEEKEETEEKLKSDDSDTKINGTLENHECGEKPEIVSSDSKEECGGIEECKDKIENMEVSEVKDEKKIMEKKENVKNTGETEKVENDKSDSDKRDESPMMLDEDEDTLLDQSSGERPGEESMDLADELKLLEESPSK